MQTTAVLFLKKAAYRLFTPLVSIIFLASCSGGGSIEFLSSSEGILREIRLENPGNPDIRFIGPEGRTGFYFEKDGEVQRLDIPYSSTVQEKDFLEIAWKVEDVDVLLTIQKGTDHYRFSLTEASGISIDKWGFSLGASENEYFTGLMEKVVDGHQSLSWEIGIETAMNLRGEKVTMLVEPTLGLYTPFYLSSANYGLFIERTWPGTYDFDSDLSGTVHVEFEGPTLEGRIWIADNPAAIVQNHAMYVGPTLVPPEWAFKPIRWRDDHSNLEQYYDGTPANPAINSMVAEDILMMKALDIPVGAYWFDRPWAKGRVGYEDFEWDEERFPNPQQMLDWLNKQGIRPLLWIAPWVAGDMAEEAAQKNYHIPMTDTLPGQHQRWQYTHNLELVDFTNEEAFEWWKGHLKTVLRQGIKGFKMDRAEEMVPYKGDFVYANGKGVREMKNAFPVYYARGAYEAALEVHGEDFLLFPRAGYTNSSRYASFWGGDIATFHEGLRAAIIAAQRSSIIGFHIWGSDIGGYWQGSMSSELTCRWLAFGCFNPLMEFGPTDNRGPWDMKYEPSYDTIMIAAWRTYAIIHDELSGYSHKMAQKSAETGMPVVRPLYLEYPDQPEAWKNWQTFKYGDEILVHALWEKQLWSTFVYLPEGTRWIDAWDPDKVYEGGQEVEIQTPIHKIPIFLSENSSLGMRNFQELFDESLEIARNVPDLKTLSRNLE